MWWNEDVRIVGREKKIIKKSSLQRNIAGTKEEGLDWKIYLLTTYWTKGDRGDIR